MHKSLPDSPIILVRARALTGYPALVTQLGGDPLALLRAVGLAEDVLDSPESPASLPAFMALLENSAVALGLPDFSLRLAQKQDIGVLGAVELIARHASSVGEAVQAIGRNMCYHSPGIAVQLEPDPLRSAHTALRITVDPRLPAGRQQMMELAYGVGHGFLRAVTGDSSDDWHMNFQHGTSLPPEHYRKYFNGPVLFGQARNGLSLPTRLLAVPIAPDNGELLASAERFVNNVMRRYPLDIAHQVEALVERQLAAGGATLAAISAQLGLHRRTLQRRLKEQGLLFEDIVDKVCQARAAEYLTYAAIPLSQVAAMLGYSEQSSFSRSCRRWFGTTPQAYRDRCMSAIVHVGFLYIRTCTTTHCLLDSMTKSL